MPISATAYETVVVLEIVGSDFRECLDQIHKIPAKDRRYDEVTHRWTIHHPDQYQHIPAIQRAIASSRSQLRLF